MRLCGGIDEKLESLMALAYNKNSVDSVDNAAVEALSQFENETGELAA